MDFDENLVKKYSSDDLTLAAHLSMDRLHMLEPLAKMWEGNHHQSLFH